MNLIQGIQAEKLVGQGGMAVYPKAEIWDNAVTYITMMRFLPLIRLLSGALTKEQDRQL